MIDNRGDECFTVGVLQTDDNPVKEKGKQTR